MNGFRAPLLINGVEYSWSQLAVIIDGIEITGITKIDYSNPQSIEPVYGIGQTPVGIGYGNFEPKASITLLRSEIEALREASVSGKLQDIAPFDIVVSFIPTNGKKVITHKIRNCVIKNDDMSIAQGDSKNEQQLDLFCSAIEYK